MPYEVTEPQIPLHDENRFYYGDLIDIVEEEGNYGKQLKWFIHIDDEEYEDDNGVTQDKITWAYCSPKLTTHENNKFRKYVKGLTGKEPANGEMFDERHWTKQFYEDNPSEDPEKLTGRKQPWRVALMFEHAKKKSDGTPYDKVTVIASEEAVR